MEEKVTGATLTVRAIAGLHVVFLAWDFTDGLPSSAGSDLLGFAIQREELDGTGTVVERYMLRGIKRFQSKDEGLESGTPGPTDEHPIQSFQWGDYTVHPATRYRFRVIPVYGRPKLLRLADDQAETVEVKTEAEVGSIGGTGVRHDILLQPWRCRFAGLRPTVQEHVHRRRQVHSRPGRHDDRTDAVVVARPVRGASTVSRVSDGQLLLLEGDALRVPLPAGSAAVQGGGRSGRRRRHPVPAQSYRDENEAAIGAEGIGRVCAPQASRSGIRHNKFVVLLHDGHPKAVWTGSTNLSLGGIFGHSNLGHAVWDDAIAERFDGYWNALTAPRVKASALRIAAVRPPFGCATPADLPASGEVMTLFSPRDAADKAKPAVTLEWYASLIERAGEVVCLTLPFNFDDTLRRAIAVQNDVLRMIVMDKKLSDEEEEAIRIDHDTLIAAGSKLSEGDLRCFAREYLTGFNRNNYIHDKFLLIDPHGEDPIVITGSANFSGPSQRNNDENMLVIRGDKRVAHIYFGEFLRIFDHFYARYLAEKIKRLGTGTPTLAISRRPRPRGSTGTATATRRSVASTSSLRFAPWNSVTPRAPAASPTPGERRTARRARRQAPGDRDPTRGPGRPGPPSSGT